MPFEYYSLPFCKPHIHSVQENLGEVLSGDRIENSVYKVETPPNFPRFWSHIFFCFCQLQMKVPQGCQIACKKELKKAEAEQFSKAIDDDYRIHW